MERLVTWLWQGTVLAVGIWGLLRVWRPNAATRYAIWWTTLVALLLLLIAPLWLMPSLKMRLPLPLPLREVVSGETGDGARARQPAGTAGSLRDALSARASAGADDKAPVLGLYGGDDSLATRIARVVNVVTRAHSLTLADDHHADSLLPVTLPAMPRALLAIGVGVWLGLALLGLLQLGVSVIELQRMKRACRPFPRLRERRLPRWRAARLTGRGARVCLSDEVRSASALGLGAAIIAINPSLLADVDDDELDHILLHEYAHIQRWDDWLQVAQLALRAVLVVHPAVSWIGRVLRLEREAACDDWVVERTQMVTTYAHCLTKVAAFELAAPASEPEPLSAAVGMVGRRGDLTHRIERLLAPRRVARTRLSAMPVASAAAALLVTLLALSQLPPLVAMPMTSPAPHLPPAANTSNTAIAANDVTGKDSANAVNAASSANANAPSGVAAANSVPSSVAAAAVDPLTLAAAVVIASERDGARTERPVVSMRRPVSVLASLSTPVPPARSMPTPLPMPAVAASATATSAQPAVSTHSALPTSLALLTLATAPTLPTISGKAALPTSGARGLDTPASSVTLARTDSGFEITSTVGATADPVTGATADTTARAIAGADSTSSDTDNALADGVAATSRYAWQRAADVGVAVGQGAADVGVTVGQGAAAAGVHVGQRAVDVSQATASLAVKTPVRRGTLGAGASVGRGAKRAGVATGGFFARVATSVTKASLAATR
jgi:beta-lactamase regulating signal transducer with metallopeptidase domain